MEEARDVPEMLTGMEEIDDLNGTGEVLVSIVPYPFGSVSNDDLLLGAIPAAVPGFEVDPVAKLAGGFDCAGVCCGAWVANGITLVIPPGLSEDAAELHFAGVGWLSVRFTCSPLSLFFDHRNACAVHLNIENRNRFSDGDRQMQLQGLIDGGLFASGDVRADGLCCPLDGFGSYLEIGEHLKLPTSLIE